MFAAVSPEDVSARRRAPDVTAAKLLRERWYEDPIVLGTLLILAPPMGLAALWSSRRYSSDARLALTIMTALVLCLGAAVTIALVAVRA